MRASLFLGLVLKKLGMQNEKIEIKKIAEAIMKLSSFYIEHPESQTPWHQDYCQLAYKHYFLPLNQARVRKVIERGLQIDFFSDLKHFIDWGCGPATASLALTETLPAGDELIDFTLIDRETNLKKYFVDEFIKIKSHKFLDATELKNVSAPRAKTCLVMAYSYTELNELPKGWGDFEALMIIEPSTQKDSRRVMALREKLIQEGYHIYAPCTHHDSCPLLNQSARDWCHDKTQFRPTEHFQLVEDLLPIKNSELTFSYLLARKRPRPDRSHKLEPHHHWARIVGDSLPEKGKTRQMICRNQNREFLAWMHKSIEPADIPRGQLVQLKNDITLKSNEVRVQNAGDLILEN